MSSMNRVTTENQNENANKHSCTIEMIAFNAYFIIMLVLKGLGFTSGIVYQTAIAVAFLCLACKIAIGKYNNIQKVVILAVTILAVFCWRSSGDLGTLFCISLIVSMKNIGKEHVFRIGAVVWTASFIALTLSQLLNLGTRDFVIHSKFGLGYIIRWALGYSHPNVLQIAYTTLVFYWMYLVHPDSSNPLHKDKKTILPVLFSVVGTLYIFLYSFSTTGLLMYLIYIFTLVLLEKRRRDGAERREAEKLLIALIFPVCVILSTLGPVILKGQAFDVINQLMNTRPALSRYYLTTYGVSLLGRDFSSLSANITLDCSYMYLLMHGGLLLFLILIIAYFCMIKWTVDQKTTWKNNNEIAMLVSFSFTAISEPFAFNTSFKNVTLILLGYYLYQVSAPYGVEKAWIPILSQIGEKEVSIPNTWARFVQFKERICHAAKKYRFPVAGIGTAAAVIGMAAVLIGGYSATRAIARRISCETDLSSTSVYYTEKEIDALRKDPEVLVLNYEDEDDPMLMFDNRNMFILEKVRGGISAALWIGIGSSVLVCCAMILIDSAKEKN